MKQKPTDFSLSLEELTGLSAGDPRQAPMPLVKAVWQSWKKPLYQLTNAEIGCLVAQSDGFPCVLDFVMPKLEADPLFEGGYYPGDVLSSLIRAEPGVWRERPEYAAVLPALYHRALERPADENDAFRESLNLPDLGAASN
ncbi:contact-dependent growth inhibition system immunity protein [Sphingomonas sp. RB56-2]|uniref:Contact-dependent growth inhibition system immunity protein n=1 Tax=Sphingomonas brevis TaxID=2908206 RepID=A0ABT0SAT2_9SPHN|nr:contact-dependent growth inhibition system immunity protein [Sphingomonas brevis]MCL6741448.1 contact-dependent growth inhibition system immunity protein [Sphingomonas brevis]